MYASPDVIRHARALATPAIVRDREQYREFLTAVEKYAAENGLIVGGGSATRLLLGPAPPGPDSYYYEFYTDQVMMHSNGLGDAIFESDPAARYTVVYHRVPGQHAVVSVDGRDLCAVHALPAHRGVQTADIVIPTVRAAQFTPERLLCMGPELRLMETYAALCDPGRAESWPELVTAEKELRTLFAREVKVKIAEAIARADGGAESPIADGGAESPIAGFKKKLWDEFVPGRLLVGPEALNVSGARSARADDVLQLVSAAPLEKEASIVSGLAASVGADVQWVILDPKVPTDVRLRRLRVYFVAEKRTPVLDVFNLASYELVPYFVSESSLHIGSPFVLMRLLLADMWTMQLIMHLKDIDSGYAKRVLKRMLTDYESAAIRYERGPPAAAFPLDTYEGRAVNAVLAARRAVNKHPQTYLPAQSAQEKQSAQSKVKTSGETSRGGHECWTLPALSEEELTS